MCDHRAKADPEEAIAPFFSACKLFKNIETGFRRSYPVSIYPINYYAKTRAWAISLSAIAGI